MMDRDQDFDLFSEALIVLAEAFDVKLSAAQINLYFEGLCDLNWPHVEVTFTQVLRTCKFFPRVAEIREIVAGGSPESLAENAWRQFWLALERCGTYRSLYCEDAILAEAIRRLYGAWADAWDIPREAADPPAYQVHHKNFTGTYRALARQPQPYEPYLVGRIEASNLATMEQWEHGTPLEQEVTYLPRQGEPESRPLRALRPGHPLIRILGQGVQPVSPAGDGDVTG